MNPSRSLVSFVLLAMAAPLAAQMPYVDGDPERGEELAQPCIACHGADGNSDNPDWPNLAGQHPLYLFEQLKHYQSGERDNAVMAGQVQGLSEQDMKDLAVHFASFSMEIGEASEEARELGESIYRGGIPAKNVPACMACHGPAGRGNPGVPYPRLGGQKASYTIDQLQAYRAGERSGYGQASIMNAIAETMSDEEIEAVASFVAGLYDPDGQRD